MVEPPDHLQVLTAREVLVHGGVLAREPDARAQLVGLPHDVEARDLSPPGVWLQERGEDADRGGLAGAVRPEQPEDRTLPNLEIQAVQR